MKYKNVLGKDFKTKGEAYEYFRKKVHEFTTFPFLSRNGVEYVELTEEAPIKQSEIIQLAKEYSSWTDEWLSRKSQGQGINKWCIIKNIVDGISSISLGFIRNKKESESNFENCTPESVSSKKVFRCLGPGQFNPNEILNAALRIAIRSQTQNFRASLKNPNRCMDCVKDHPSNMMVVDHVVPFKDIVEEFFKFPGRKKFMSNSLFKDGCVHDIKGTSPDEEFYPGSPKEYWQEFHHEKAMLQMLCKTCHDRKTYGL